MMLTILTTAWSKVYGYVAAIAVALAAIAAIYFRGRTDANNDTERRVLGKDLENRRTGDSIRGDVNLADAPAERLRRWQRPGN
jgi:hypothetical protein